MGFLDPWTRRAISRREGRVSFLGDQSGSSEDTLKRELILEFATRPDIRRAYLARVSFDGADEQAALCILSSRPDDQGVVTRIGEIARRRYGNEPTFEILLLTEEQDADLARVSRPFYSTAAR